MKLKIKIVRYAMLMVSIMMLFSVIIPHHHHSNGLPCYTFVTEQGSDNHDNTSDTACNGHNIALYTSVLTHATDGDVVQYLFPLLVVFDYINPPDPDFCRQLAKRDRTFYIESLHDTWIASASGLRAPPML